MTCDSVRASQKRINISEDDRRKYLRFQRKRFMALPQSTKDTDSQCQQLVQWMSKFHRVWVAFSGGVDSAVVAKGASIALGDRAVAVTAASPSLASGELGTAKQVASEIGISHQVIQTNEYENDAYRANAGDRCYHCKSALYGQLRSLSSHLISNSSGQRNERREVVVSGTNVDDLGDYRPGLVAADENGVRHPLAELGMSKSDVRNMARHWGISVSEKPAAPCLASRIAYGESVTRERLARIGQAEQFVRELGFPIVRVRLLPDEVGRVEVEPNRVEELVANYELLVANHLQKLGFGKVEIAKNGYRSGAMNDDLSLTQRQLFTIYPLPKSPKES